MYAKVNKEARMDQASTSKDFAVFYTQDGKPLADYIQEKFGDTRFDCTVDTVDITDACKNLRHNCDSPRSDKAKINIIVVSPSFLSYAISSKAVPYDDIFPVPEKTVALFFYVDVQEANKLVEGLSDKSPNWQRKDTGNNKESLRECLVTLITLLEEESVVPLPVLKRFSFVPSTLTTRDDKVYIHFTQETHGKVEIQQDNERMVALFYNPFTYVFSPLGHYCGTSEVQVFINGASAGKESLVYLSKTEEMERLLMSVTNPLDVLCAAVIGEGNCSTGILDQTLDHMFCNSSCVVTSGLDVVNKVIGESRDQEYPTLLHLAARYGLKNLAGSILDTPGGKLAVDIKNRDDLTPVDIAVKYEHRTLAKSLKASPSKETDDQDIQRDKQEAYCDMTVDKDKKMTEVAPKSTGHYDSIDDRSPPDVKRSISSPAKVEPYAAVYMDMDALKEAREFRPRIGPRKEAKLPDVTRRQRSKTADSGTSRESARISLIKEEDIMVLPRLTRREERIYTSINDIPNKKKTPHSADTANLRKS